MSDKHGSGHLHRARRILAAAGMSVVLLGLAGCIDVVQYLSGSADDVDIYFRLTLQKSVFELVNALGDAPQDMDEIFKDFNLNEDEVVRELPPGVEADYRPVNTDFDYGFELRYSVPRSILGATSEPGNPFIPLLTPRGLSIPLSEGNGSSETDEFASAFLGSAKYRLFISKRLVSRVSAARILAGPESTAVTITDLPDVWLLEFPLSLWYTSDYSPVLEVLF